MLEIFLSAIKTGSFLVYFILHSAALLATPPLVMITVKSRDQVRRPLLSLLLLLTIFLSAKYIWGSSGRTEQLPSNTVTSVMVVPSRAASPPPGGEAACPALLEPLDLLDDQFWAMGRVFAHGSHSLTLNTLRYFFTQTAPEQNAVPVVSPEMTGPAILDSAPFIQTDHRSGSHEILLLVD